MNKGMVVVILSVLCLAASCSLLDNRKKLAQEYLETQIAQESGGAITLLKFEKIDGESRTEGGVNSYIMDFRATIEYEEDCYKSSGPGWGNNGPYNDFTVMKSQPNGWDRFLSGQLYHFQKGTKVILTGQADFEKKESGWSVSRRFRLSNATEVK